jgi:hypothetical protein
MSTSAILFFFDAAKAEDVEDVAAGGTAASAAMAMTRMSARRRNMAARTRTTAERRSMVTSTATSMTRTVATSGLRRSLAKSMRLESRSMRVMSAGALLQIVSRTLSHPCVSTFKPRFNLSHQDFFLTSYPI